MKKIYLFIIFILTISCKFSVNAEEITIKAVSYYDYERLAHLIMAEGGSDDLPYDVPYGCGSVVLNRIKHKNYPNTIYDVIHQPGQYACAGYYMSLQPTNRCYQIAYELLQHDTDFPDNVIYQAQFTQGSGVYLQSNGEYFCYE